MSLKSILLLYFLLSVLTVNEKESERVYGLNEL